MRRYIPTQVEIPIQRFLPHLTIWLPLFTLEALSEFSGIGHRAL